MFDSISFQSNTYFGFSTTLFISDSILCEFAMLPDVYILMSPQEKQVHLLPKGTDVHIW